MTIALLWGRAMDQGVKQNKSKNIKMNTPIITMDKEEAKAHYHEYLSATKVRKEKYVEELKNLYRHLSEGAKVLDIYAAFKESGVNKFGDPNLGIAPADVRQITFVKESLGGGHFSKGRWPDRYSVALPSGTFGSWKTISREDAVDRKREWETGNIERQQIVAKVPLIPPLLLPESKSLDGYYVLFEVEKWDEIPTAKDPYLLKRINANAFVVLAEWDVTEIELAVVRGLN